MGTSAGVSVHVSERGTPGAEQPGTGVVRLVYRSYGGENAKSRPEWFSKDLALLSFARAARLAGCEPLWLNDGPIPPHRLAIMEGVGEVRPIPGGPVGLRGSYVAALRLATDGHWRDDDIAYFAEDDYLHTADAFVSLTHAARDLPDVAYFALYASTPRHPGPAEWPDGYRFPDGWVHAPDRVCDGRTWVNVASTASTFGARVGALRQDLPFFRQCMRPFRRRFLDHETCLLYQGHVPYRNGRTVLLGLPGDFVPGLRGVARTAFLVPFRVALDASAWRNRRTTHRLYAVDPNLACHVELGMMTPGRDWGALAREVADWAGGEGLAVPALAGL